MQSAMASDVLPRRDEVLPYLLCQTFGMRAGTDVPTADFRHSLPADSSCGLSRLKLAGARTSDKCGLPSDGNLWPGNFSLLVSAFVADSSAAPRRMSWKRLHATFRSLAFRISHHVLSGREGGAWLKPHRAACMKTRLTSREENVRPRT
jgi:hypothetical protein